MGFKGRMQVSRERGHLFRPALSSFRLFSTDRMVEQMPSYHVELHCSFGLQRARGAARSQAKYTLSRLTDVM